MAVRLVVADDAARRRAQQPMMSGEMSSGTPDQRALYATFGLCGSGTCGKADRHNGEYRNPFHWSPHIVRRENARQATGFPNRYV
jgi:hypothetical protein